MEDISVTYSRDCFKTSFDKEDLSKSPAFKEWLALQKKEGIKVVRCPHCWGYEKFVVPSNHKCTMCNRLYCQKCLKPCVQDEVRHDHERTCCSKLKGLIETMKDWGSGPADDMTCCLLFGTSLVFIFGNHVLYTIKYFKFFQKNKIIDSECTHNFFKYLNLFANICYCIINTVLFIEFFSLLFFPAIFIICYFRFLIYNWVIVLEFEVDESPITELTVRGKGYGLY